jgi:hypothetical protein
VREKFVRQTAMLLIEAVNVTRSQASCRRLQARGEAGLREMTRDEMVATLRQLRRLAEEKQREADVWLVHCNWLLEARGERPLS